MTTKILYGAEQFIGGVAEWSMAADCKSARVCVHRFKSYSLHHPMPRLRVEGLLGLSAKATMVYQRLT